MRVTSLPAIYTRANPFAILFFAEMVLSPLIAGTAILVPVAADWGGYKYLPAIVWLLIFVQCLFTFRSRGLWFLLGLPFAFVAIEVFLVAAPPVPKQEVRTPIIGFEYKGSTKLRQIGHRSP